MQPKFGSQDHIAYATCNGDPDMIESVTTKP